MTQHNVPFALPDVGHEEAEAVAKVIRSGWITSGKEVIAFEKEFAQFVGAEHAIAVNSATNAALLLLDRTGLKKGKHEVIFPTYTFSGPAMMAHKLGYEVVLADNAPNSFMMDVQQAVDLVDRNTLAIVPTHFGGAAFDLPALYKALPSSSGVRVFDDAAHAFPTMIGDQFVGGCFAVDATFFSFYATKTLACGDGGMITTNDPSIAARMLALRTHGFSKEIHDRYTNKKTGWEYDIAHPGWKANMTDMTAAMGRVQLDRALTMQVRRLEIAMRYIIELQGLAELPKRDPDSAWHLFPILVDERDDFIAGMAEQGVQCSVHFKPLHLHSYWQKALGVRQGMFPNAEKMYAREVSLPIYSGMTDKDVDRVIEAVKETVGLHV